MNTTPWRAFLRLVILPAMVGGAVFVSVGGVSAGTLFPAQAVEIAINGATAGGISTGAEPEPDHSQIVAFGQLEFGYSVPMITVQEVEQPKPVARRAVTNSPIPPSVAGNAVLEVAARYVGTPYVRGGTTPAGFDCTGFVSFVYAQFGISLPHSSSSYWNIGTRVSPQDALPGDLIVSNGHVGIYAGGNLQIDAPREGKTIQFRGIWQTSYIFVRVS